MCEQIALEFSSDLVKFLLPPSGRFNTLIQVSESGGSFQATVETGWIGRGSVSFGINLTV